MGSLCWECVICGHCAYKDIKLFCRKIPSVEKTSNAETIFAVAIVKAESIIGHIPCKFCFALAILHNFQLYFSGVTLPSMPHVLVCAPISHA